MRAMISHHVVLTIHREKKNDGNGADFIHISERRAHESDVLTPMA
jgi:hypothetical protein